MRKILIVGFLFLALYAAAQDRQSFTLYDAHSGAARRIKEGKYIDVAILSDRCPEWKERHHGVSGRLLGVDSNSITIAVSSEGLTCTQGDSTFTWFSEDGLGQTRTIPHDRILSITRGGEGTPEVISGAVFGLSVMTVLIVAPLASLQWFNGWGFNAETYQTIAQAGIIGVGIGMPLYLVFSSRTKLVPMELR